MTLDQMYDEYRSVRGLVIRSTENTDIQEKYKGLIEGLESDTKTALLAATKELAQIYLNMKNEQK